MQEEWKDIIGYNGKYQVSNFGNVRSTDRYYRQDNGKGFESEHLYKGKMLKPFYTERGYKRIGLSQKGKVKYYTIHKLVAMAFISNPNNLPQVNHKDGNKENNKVDNLEWCDSIYNNRHARIMGLNKGNKGISYKNRCLKAVEYIKTKGLKEEEWQNGFCEKATATYTREEIFDLLNILQGENNE